MQILKLYATLCETIPTFAAPDIVPLSTSLGLCRVPPLIKKTQPAVAIVISVIVGITLQQSLSNYKDVYRQYRFCLNRLEL